MPALSSEWTLWSLMNGIPALFAAVAFLFYRPFQTLFAWDVRDRQSGIFFATGFLLRAALFVHVMTAKSWGEIRWLTWGNAVFAAVLLGVTLVWGDKFSWSRPIAIIWLYLYIEEPVWMLTLVPRAQAEVGAEVLAGAEVMSVTKIVLFVEAAVMLAAGIYVFFMDRFANPIWPWRPDMISARVMAGFPLAFAVWAPALALAPTWSESRGGVLLNIFWLAAIFVSLLVFRSQFDRSKRPTQIYLAVVAALLVGLGAVYLLQG